jgi:hypothetical protein
MSVVALATGTFQDLHNGRLTPTAGVIGAARWPGMSQDPLFAGGDLRPGNVKSAKVEPQAVAQIHWRSLQSRDDPLKPPFPRS